MSTRTVSIAWMMPLSHSTSDGQLDDLEGPSDLRPMIAPSSQFLRNLRYAVSVPPLSVFWSVFRASIVFLPSITWYLSTSAVIGVPTSLLCLSKAELVEVVVALDVGLVVAEEHAVRAPH